MPTLPGDASAAFIAGPPMAHMVFRDHGPMRVGTTEDIEVRISAADEFPVGLTDALAGDGPIRIFSFPLPPPPLQPLVTVY
jgi:hypothetical protein